MPHLPPPSRLSRARFFLLLFSALGLAIIPLSARAAYVLSSEEALIADYMVHDPGQQRTSMQLDPILARVARERAEDLAARNYFSHVNPDGNGPNTLVRAAGYVLPAWWGTGVADNYIESIAAGRSLAADTWADWMASTPHRNHILAIDPFYRNQTSYGVGYAYTPNGNYHHYWVILTAPPNATAGNAALFISQSVPATMVTGLTYSVSVSMLNTGSNSWTTVAGYQLSSQSPAANLTWGLSRVNLPSAVSPGSAVTFDFVVSAPGVEGTSDFQWQMQQEGVGLFGEQTPLVPIPVGLPAPPPPPYVAPASTYSYSAPSSSSSSSSKKKKKKKSKKK